MTRVFQTIIVVFSLLAFTSQVSAVLVFRMYAAGMDSSWNVNENWDPWGVPHNSGPIQYHAYIPAPHVISLDLAATVTVLSMTTGSQIWIGDLKTFTFFGATTEPGGSKVFNQGRIRVAAEDNPTTIRIDGGPVEFISTEDGEVWMEPGFDGGYSQIVGTGGVTSSWLINREGHTFRGAGYFRNSLNVINEGLIMADNPEMGLQIRVPDFTLGGTFANDGILRAKDGAVLGLMRTSTTVTARYVHELGVVEALDGSQVLIDGRTIQHYGDFKTAGSGVIRVIDNFCSVRGPFYLDGNMRVDDGVTLDIDGTIVLMPNAKLWIDTVSPSAGGLRLTSLGDATLSGGGIVELGDNANNHILSGASNRRLTNAGCTIRGGGKLGDNGLSITNQSIIEANAAVNPLRIDPPNTGDFTNDAGGWLVASTSPGIIIDEGPFINNGLVRILSTSSLTRTGTYQQNGGWTEADGPLTITGGSLALAGGSLYATAPISVSGGLNNSGGYVNPGGIGQSPHTLELTGNYAQGALGTLSIQIGGTTAGSQHDQLFVNGNVTLGGTLLAGIINDFQPKANDAFLIISNYNGTISGEFDTVIGDWDVHYYDNAVIITPVVPIMGDITGDGVVNVNDLLIVINSWGACDKPCPPVCDADVTGDCVVNVNDLLVIINNWG